MASTDYKQAFGLFDEAGNGQVPLHKLGDLLRSCGQNPTMKEIEQLEQNVGGNSVTFETFSRILNRPGGFEEQSTEDEDCRGFRVFDKDGTNMIGVGQLRYILTNMGEKFKDEEVDQLLQAFDCTSGMINYVDLVRTVRSG